MSRFVSPGIPPDSLRALSELDPHKIYLENVRSILRVSSKKAQSICEAAVRQGIFEEYVELRCPDGSVPASAKNESDLPSIVHCWIEEDGHEEETEMESAQLHKVTFYRIVS